MERRDIAIIGTGPGGVSAAITAKIRGKQLWLFGTRHLSEKLEKAKTILNYPGLPAVSGMALADGMRAQLKSLDIPILETQVTAVYAMGDYFAIQTPTEMYEASAVILAAGVVMGKPFPGEKELLGRGVSYCATCDAPFYRDKTVAVVGYSEHSREEASFLAETAKEVLYFPAVPHEAQAGPKVRILEDKPAAILGGTQVTALEGRSGAVYPVDGVFILRDAVAPDQLVPGIALEGSHVAVNSRMETNLTGLFACGDITGTPYQYIKAAGQGNVAALSAVSYLTGKRKEEIL